MGKDDTGVSRLVFVVGNKAVNRMAAIVRTTAIPLSTHPTFSPILIAVAGARAAQAHTRKGARMGSERFSKRATMTFVAFAVFGSEQSNVGSCRAPDANVIAEMKMPVKLHHSVPTSHPPAYFGVLGVSGNRCQPPAAPKRTAPWMVPLGQTLHI